MTRVARAARGRTGARGSGVRLLTTAVLAVALAGCAPSAQTPSPTPSPTVAAVRVTVVGDSLATGGLVDYTLQDQGSWVEFLGSGVRVVGGWHKDGATTVLMAANLRSAPAQVLVLMGGTNDLRFKVPAQTSLDDLGTIVTKSGAQKVLLSTIPPYGPNPEASTAFNTGLREAAAQNGWTLVDPWGPYRGIDGGWLSGDTADGYHPTRAIYRAVGAELGRAAAELAK